jgi:hypothetical protein
MCFHKLTCVVTAFCTNEFSTGTGTTSQASTAQNDYCRSWYGSSKKEIEQHHQQVAVNMLKNSIYGYNIYLGLLLRVCVSTPRVVHLVPPETTF